MRRSWKRLCSAMLCCAVLLSGCAGGAQTPGGGAPAGTEAAAAQDLLSPNSPVELTVWHYYNSTQLTAFDNMVAEFNQTTGHDLGIYVTAHSQGNVNDLAEKVLDTARGVAGAGSLPDIFVAYPDSAYELLQMDLLADVSAYMDDEDIAEYVDSFWQEGIIPPGDSVVIFPIAKSTEVLFLDALAWQQFREALGDSLDPAEALATWEGVLRAAEDYYTYTDALTPDIPHDGHALLGLDAHANYVLGSLKQQGVDLVTVEDGEPVFDFDRNALRRVWDTYVTPMAAGHFGVEGRFRSDDVKTGYLMGFIGSSTGSSYFPDVITHDDGTQQPAQMLALPIPAFADGSAVAIQQGGGMCVTKSDAAHEYAAVVFLMWLTEAERNIDFATSSSYLPVKNEALYGTLMEETIRNMADSGDVVRQNTAQVFEVALFELEHYEMYFTPPYTGGLEVRYVLDDLELAAVDARQAVLLALEEGVDYDEAVAAASGDEAFDSWYGEFVRRIESVVSEAQ